jgi:hypothetical protein
VLIGPRLDAPRLHERIRKLTSAGRIALGTPIQGT